MQAFLSHRAIHLLFLLGCSGLVLTAIFIEPFKSLNPCPMCMMQRGLFVAIAAISLVAVIHGARAWGRRVYAVLTGVTAMLGAGVAGRQIWLQNLPEEQVPACGPGLDFMLEVFPLMEVLEMALRGTGDCAEVQWQWLGLTIPGWSLIGFVGMVLISVYMLFSKRLG